MKTCIKCGKTKPLSEFHQSKRMKDGHRSDCKTCHNRHHRNHHSVGVWRGPVGRVHLGRGEW